jgi:glycerol-3-phosphate dehydrogenase
MASMKPKVRHLMEKEWARTADDVLFRRTRLGIRMSEAEREALADWMAKARAGA